MLQVWLLKPNFKSVVTFGKGAQLCSLLYFRRSRSIVSLFLMLSIVSCFPERENDKRSLSPNAQTLVDTIFAPFIGDTLIDNHVHILGLGSSESGIIVHSDARSIFHPIKLTRFNYFLEAGSVKDESLADQQYLSYLLSQMDEFPVPFRVRGLALDRLYLESGEIDLDRFEIYVPNAYVVGLSQKYPDNILPAISIHPYREDAIDELKKWSAQGVRVVKWVPNAQAIDPSSEFCTPFFEAMSSLNMILLSHAGTENALDSQGRQHLGNPLLLRNALAKQVKVIVCHCSTAGKSVDIEDEDGRVVENFELFMRMFDDPQYEGLLYADISAMALINQVGDPLKTMLARDDLHPRLLYGSDYPLPAVEILNQNYALGLLGYLDDDIIPALNEIQESNPLLYSFVLMRSLQHPETGARFSEDLFRNQIP